MVNNGLQMWHEFYSNVFKQLLVTYQEKIAYVFCGHLHGGFFRYIDGISIILNPSISPLFGNNPGFRHYDLSQNNYVEYTYNAHDNSHKWFNYSFVETFGFDLNYYQLFNKLSTNEEIFEEYLKKITGWWMRSNYQKKDLWKIYYGYECDDRDYCMKLGLCTMKSINYYEFLVCLAEYGYRLK